MISKFFFNSILWIRVTYFPVLSQVASLVLNSFNGATIKIWLNVIDAKSQNTTGLELHALSDYTVIMY